MSKTKQKTPSQKFKETIFTLSPNTNVKIPLFEMAITPLKLIFKNWQKVFLLGVPFALLLSIFSMSFGRSILCNSIENFSIDNNLCSDSVTSFYTDTIIRFILMTIFAYKWYEFALQEKTFLFKNFFKINLNWLKATGLITIIFILNIMPIVSLFLLMIRVPNPNWKIELLYFTSIAWMFLLPIIALRFYSIVAFAFSGEKIPSVRKIWHNTAGNMLKLLLSVSLIVFLALFLFMQYYGAIHRLVDISFWTAFVAEFEYNILILLFIALYTNYSYVQKTLIFKGYDNEQ